jgi:hypothetical protein
VLQIGGGILGTTTNTIRGYYPTVTQLREVDKDLKVITNHHMRHQKVFAIPSTHAI